ncbi:nitrogen fixation-related uncharacterized protein [Nitrobacter vulgaris]|jgi:hypothetical protein|uniref:hypothetical protein n=1 Tax=Nitrobacter vulgaris TaxID=29421 RepID=UPI00285BC3BE|nr:hypothetical protein [Nitrobacter vulgaris]MDR6305821.1 nitrogen fixation-related uncharacterized protein [Nitrobacter vulgaris]
MPRSVLACVALVAGAVIAVIFHPLFVAGALGLLGLLWCVGRAIEALMGRAP